MGTETSAFQTLPAGFLENVLFPTGPTDMHTVSKLLNATLLGCVDFLQRSFDESDARDQAIMEVEQIVELPETLAALFARRGMLLFLFFMEPHLLTRFSESDPLFSKRLRTAVRIPTSSFIRGMSQCVEAYVFTVLGLSLLWDEPLQLHRDDDGATATSSHCWDGQYDGYTSTTTQEQPQHQPSVAASRSINAEASSSSCANGSASSSTLHASTKRSFRSLVPSNNCYDSNRDNESRLQNHRLHDYDHDHETKARAPKSMRLINSS
jgi:hypothetical protein